MQLAWMSGLLGGVVHRVVDLQSSDVENVWVRLPVVLILGVQIFCLSSSGKERGLCRHFLVLFLHMLIMLVK
jgi:hypothetical protein